MTYSKPEVTVLGNAVELIQSKKVGPTIDQNQSPAGAYDLDEE